MAKKVRKLSAAEQNKAIAEVNSLHAEIITVDASSLDKAIKIGTILTKLKKAAGHKNWLGETGYLAQYLPNISERTAQDYLWAAKNVAEIEAARAKSAPNGKEPNPQRSADLTTISGAKRALKPAKEPLTEEERQEAEKEKLEAAEEKVKDWLIDQEIDDVASVLASIFPDQLSELIGSLQALEEDDDEPSAQPNVKPSVQPSSQPRR